MKEQKTTKAYCVINKKTGKITMTEYGTAHNVALNVYPMSDKGEKNALGSFTGSQEVVECEIKVVRRHKCDCEYCNRKHWTVRKED